MNRSVLVTAGHIVALANELRCTFVRSNNDNAMSKQSATEYIFATTTARFNAGYQDAINEMSFGKDRRFVEHGKPFCLPADNNYCKGYHQAFTDHRNSIAA